EITVLDAIPIDDAPAPQFQRDLGADAAKKSDPAAIFASKPLRLAVTLKARENPTEPAKLALVAKDATGGSQLMLQGQAATVSDFVSGQRIEIASLAPLTSATAVNALRLAFEANGAPVTSGSIDVRIYTTLKAPIKNITNDRTEPATKLHYELACAWANGAT